MESASVDDNRGRTVMRGVPEKMTTEKGISTRIAASEMQDKGGARETSSKDATNDKNIKKISTVGVPIASLAKQLDPQSAHDVPKSLSCPRGVPEKGPAVNPVMSDRRGAKDDNSQSQGKTDKLPENKRGVESSLKVALATYASKMKTFSDAVTGHERQLEKSVPTSAATASQPKTGTSSAAEVTSPQSEVEYFKKSASRTNATQDVAIDLSLRGKTVAQNQNPSISKPSDTALKIVRGDTYVTITASKETRGQTESVKSVQQIIPNPLGLKNIGAACIQAEAKSKGYFNEGVVRKEVGQQAVAKNVALESCGKQSEQNIVKTSVPQTAVLPVQVPQPKLPTADQLAKAGPDAGAKFSAMRKMTLTKPVGVSSSRAEVGAAVTSSTTDDKSESPASNCPSTSSSATTNPAKNTPIYIKFKLEDQTVTIICCPLALLLQHKDHVNVTLQAQSQCAYSIECRKCSHKLSEPCAMLHHLKEEHQIRGCLQKLLNLNSQYLGCMSRPVCVNIPGVLTLPEGLADMEQGVIRFNNMGVPRLSFVCRLCPLNFHTARGLSAHHQYFMRSLFSKDNPVGYNSRWTCKLCPQQFKNFLDFYSHHKWMRIAKDLFINSDPVIKKKKFEVMNECGKVVASVEVPRTHSMTIRTVPGGDSDCFDNIGWGQKANPTVDKSTHSNSNQRISEIAVHPFDADSQIPSTATTTTTMTQSASSQQQTETDKGKETTPLFRTLDHLCRKIAQKAETSPTSSDKPNLVGDKLEFEETEYMCAICHKTFPRLAQMQGHMGSHIKQRRHIFHRKLAPVTNAQLTTPTDSPSVDRPPAAEPQDIEYKCGVCSKTFPRLIQMQDHMECHNRQHPPTNSPVKSLQTPFSETVKLMSLTCDICHWSFPSERKLWDHRVTHTQNKKPDEPEAVSHTADSTSVPTCVQKKTIYVCVVCKKSFAREVNLRFHLKRHAKQNLPRGSDQSPKAIAQRSKKGARTTRSQGSVEQDQIEPPSRQVCTSCGKSFNSLRQLTSHKAVHAKFQKGAETSPVSLTKVGRRLKPSHFCRLCQRTFKSAWHLRVHKKKHTRTKKLLVKRILADEETKMVKQRTLAQRACNVKKNEGVSDKDSSGGSIQGKAAEQKKQKVYSFYCKDCHRHFHSSHHFARHLAKHCHWNRSKAKQSSGNLSSRGEHSQTSKEPVQKQTNRELRALSRDNANTSAVLEGPSRKTRSQTTEAQPPENLAFHDISSTVTEDTICPTKATVTCVPFPEGTDAHSQTGIEPTKQSNEISVHSTGHEDSSMEIESAAQESKPRVTESQSSESENGHSHSADGPIQKQNSEVTVLSADAVEPCPVVGDSCQDTRPSASDARAPGTIQIKEKPLETSKAPVQKQESNCTDGDESNAVIEGASQETRPRVTSAHSHQDEGQQSAQIGSEWTHTQDGELSTYAAVTGELRPVMEEPSTETIPILTNAQSVDSSKRGSQTSKGPMQEQNSKLTINVEDCGDSCLVVEDVSQETRHSANIQATANDERQIQTSDEPTQKQDDERSLKSAICDDSSVVMEDSSQEMRPIRSDEPRQGKPSQKQYGELEVHSTVGDNSSTVMAGSGQEKRPNASTLETDKQHPQISSGPEQTHVGEPATHITVPQDLSAAVKDSSREKGPNEIDVLSVESNKKCSRNAVSADDGDSDTEMEGLSQETRPNTSDSPSPEQNEGHPQTTGATNQKCDNEHTASTACGDSSSLTEAISLQTTPNSSDTPSSEKDAVLPWHDKLCADPTAPVGSCVSMEDVSHETRPSETDAGTPECSETHSQTGETPAQKLDDEPDNLRSVKKDTSQANGPSTSYAASEQSEKVYPQISDTPTQNQQRGLDLQSTACEDADPSTDDGSQETRPIISDALSSASSTGHPQTNDVQRPKHNNEAVSHIALCGSIPMQEQCGKVPALSADTGALDAVMQDASQETRPSAVEAESSETGEACPQSSEVPTEKLGGEPTVDQEVSDDSSPAMSAQQTEQSEAGVQTTKDNERHPQTVDEAKEKWDGELTMQSPVPEDLHAETRNAGSRDSRPSASDVAPQEVSKVPTEEQGTETTAEATASDDTCEVMGDTSQETRPSTAYVDSAKGDSDKPHSHTRETLPANSTAHDDSTASVEHGSNETKPSTADALSSETKKEYSQTSDIPAQKHDGKPVDSTVCNEPCALREEVVMDTQPSTSCALSSASGKEQTQVGNASMLKQADEPDAPSTDCTNSHASMEDTSQETRPVASEAFLEGDTEFIQTTEVCTHSQDAESLDAVAVTEDTSQESRPIDSPAKHKSLNSGILTKPNRYTCDICNRGFAKKFQLRGHKAMHAKNGEGPYAGPDSPTSKLETGQDESAETGAQETEATQDKPAENGAQETKATPDKPAENGAQETKATPDKPAENGAQETKATPDKPAETDAQETTKSTGVESLPSLTGDKLPSQPSKIYVLTRTTYSTLGVNSGPVVVSISPNAPNVQTPGSFPHEKRYRRISKGPAPAQTQVSQLAVQSAVCDNTSGVIAYTSQVASPSVSGALSLENATAQLQDGQLTVQPAVHNIISPVVIVGTSLETRPIALGVGKSPSNQTNSQSSRSEVENKKFACSQCERTFSHINQLNAHKRFHTNALKIQNRQNSDRYLVKHTSGKLFKCDICQQTFKDFKRLCGHRGAHVSHKMTKFKKYTKSQDAGSGIESQKANSQDPDAAGPSVAGRSVEPHGRYSCKLCNKSFHNLGELKDHADVHPMAKGKLFLQRPFQCEICGKSFTKSKQKTLHMKLHARNRRRRRYKMRVSLQDTDHSYYKKMPANSRNTAAGKSQESQEETSETIKEGIAEGETAPADASQQEKTYDCQLCEKSFKVQHQLAGHMNLHKRYSCRLCDASFTLARQLCGHLKVHGGMKKSPLGKTQDDSSQNDSSSAAGINPSASSPSRPLTRFVASSQSSALLKRVIKIYLSGTKVRQRRRGKGCLAKYFHPKRSLQRAFLKHHQARMQKLFGVLRKSVILEIEADSQRLVYECKECKESSYCHKAILRHYLESHLQQTEGSKGPPPVPSGGKEDLAGAPPQRFRNKSKIGCPICKVSSGFQCHLHNEDGFMDIDAILENDEGKDLFACEKCDERFPTHSKLVQHRQVHSKRQPETLFSCPQCPFTTESIFGLTSHQRVHREKGEKNSADSAQGDKKVKPLTCSVCSFQVNSIHGLAAHSKIHKGRGKRRLLLNDTCTPKPAQSPATSTGTAQKSETSTETAQNPETSSGTTHSSEARPRPAESNASLPEGVKQRKGTYSCSVCPRYFFSVVSFRKHMKTHTDYYRYKCAQCLKAFQYANELYDHINTAHSARNPYRCTECSFSSLSSESLEHHLHVHSGAKNKKDRKANWSAYLKEVLRIRGAGVGLADANESPVKEKSSPNLSYNSEASSSDPAERAGRVSNQKPHHAESPTSKSSKPGVSIAKEVGAHLSFDTGTPKPFRGEGSPQRSSDSPDEFFACSQCKDFQASTQAEWDRHMEEAHNDIPGTKLKCGMCQYTTLSKERLEQHMKLHRNMTLQCDSCSYRTPQRHLMIRHVQTVHKQHKPFKCKFCTYCTAYRHHLRRHSEKHKNPNFRCRYRRLLKTGDWHSVETESTGSRVSCNLCGRELRNKKTLRNHYIRIHGRIPHAKRGVKGPGVQRADGTPKGPFLKLGKGKQPTFSIIHQDADSVSSEKMFKCSVCSLKFKHCSDLNQHMAQGHPKPKASLPCQCPQCGFVTGSGQLQAHMLIHQEENLLECEEEGCDFKTAEMVHLQRHQTKHAVEREALNTCRFCQLKFPDANSLQMHNTQTHSNQTSVISARAPFKCSQCPYISSNEKDANRHFRLHNYNLAFKCDYCVFSTSTASAIATHRKIHRYPRRSSSAVLVSKKPMQQQKLRSGGPVKVADNQDGSASSVVPERPRPKHVFVSSGGKKLYECRYCQRFFEVAEAWQRHELRHLSEWPQY